MDLGIYYGQNMEQILEKIQNIDCRNYFNFNFDFDFDFFSYQSVELRNKMFAKELKRGKSAPKNQDSIQSSFNESSDYCFDGENLILNHLTYQYIDLTYQPLQEIVNYPGGIRETVSVN